MYMLILFDAFVNYFCKILFFNKSIIEFDFLKPEDIGNAFADKEFDVAYYFIHSLSDTHNSLFQFEKTCASCFINVAHITKVKQIIYWELNL